jgi:two-component sensor histidine kinase
MNALIARAGRGERVAPYEMPHIRKVGSIFEAQVTLSAAVDRSSQVVGISKVMRDITSQKNIENQIRASLREKDVLLREIHHRVKNNLQVIASLLNIQLSAERSDAARKSLLESQSRIQSMALVHQLLYLSKDLANIDAGEYLSKLTSRLVETYNIAPDRIVVHVFAQPIRLDIDRAIPCGLIVNELVTNALIHGFPDQRSGRIWVTIERAGDDVLLTVADDGIGMPADLQIEKATTFGLRIAHTLTMQLDGTISLTREHGTAIRVVFPIAARG